jgi:hypothetical protein
MAAAPLADGKDVDVKKSDPMVEYCRWLTESKSSIVTEEDRRDRRAQLNEDLRIAAAMRVWQAVCEKADVTGQSPMEVVLGATPSTQPENSSQTATTTSPTVAPAGSAAATSSDPPLVPQAPLLPNKP